MTKMNSIGRQAIAGTNEGTVAHFDFEADSPWIAADEAVEVPVRFFTGVNLGSGVKRSRFQFTLSCDVTGGRIGQSFPCIDHIPRRIQLEASAPLDEREMGITSLIGLRRP